MKPAHALAFVLFVVWAGWLVAAQAWLGRPDLCGRARPDLGLVFALALAARTEPAALPFLAFGAALARASACAEPSIVLFTGFLGVLFASLALRSIVEVQTAPWRALVAGALAFALEAWIVLAHGARDAGAGFAAADLARGWPAALSTSLAALLVAPALARLPGLSPLRTRRW